MSFNDFLIAWCARGSQGLLAEWLRDKPTPSRPDWRTEQRNRIQQAVPGVAEQNQSPTDFFDVEARNVLSLGMGR
jgi:hypothetical protein